jgi:hypothetical protein
MEITRKTQNLNIHGSCIRTCMIKVKPPPFFDYEDTHSDSHHQSGECFDTSINHPTGKWNDPFFIFAGISNNEMGRKNPIIAGWGKWRPIHSRRVVVNTLCVCVSVWIVIFHVWDVGYASPTAGFVSLRRHAWEQKNGRTRQIIKKFLQQKMKGKLITLGCWAEAEFHLAASREQGGFQA